MDNQSMTNPIDNSWADTKSILLELEQLFTRDDDVKDIEDIKKMGREIEEHCKNNLKSANELIKEMTSIVADKEMKITAPSEVTHTATIDKIIIDKENVNAQIEQLRQILDNKRENITKMAVSSLSLKEKSSEYAGSIHNADTRTSYALSLYTKISNISWDYSAPAGKLAGCIGNDSTKELKTFSIDSRALTSYEVANTLWDMIRDNVCDTV